MKTKRREIFFKPDFNLIAISLIILDGEEEVDKLKI